MLGIGKKKKAKFDPEQEIASLLQKLKDKENEIAGLRIEIQARSIQLTFWHEQCRSLENQLRVAQQLHMGTLDTMRQINEVPVDMETELGRVKAALAAQPSVESLIMAVALSSSRDIEMIRRLFPEIAEALPAPKPPVQRITDVSGERTAIRG